MTEKAHNSNNPWLVTLLFVGVIAIVVALFLAGAAGAELGSYRSDAKAVASLTAWSNFLLTVGAMALVGLLVVGGVAWTLRHLER